VSAWYATVEDVSRALGAKSTAYADHDLRRAVEAGSADVDDVVQWISGAFRPIRKTIYREWPPRQTTDYYRLWLDANPLLSVEALTSGGATIAPADFFLEPQEYGPPYTRIEIDRGSSASFSYTDATPQRAVGILGLWGLGDDRAAAGALAGGIDDSVTTIVVTDGSSIGTGEHLVIEDERLEVTARGWSSADVLDAAGLAESKAATTVPLVSGTVFADELLLVDGERMRVVDVAGTTAVVRRAQDGSVLAAHAGAAVVYARRSLTVVRGARGTTAAAHPDTTAIERHVVPGDANALCVASALVTHLQETTAYAREIGAQGATTKIGEGLDKLREQVAANYGRQCRMRVV
jgi:hypothetical protein